ncbi:glycosyltransferase family 4 protein [Pseudomonas leptonychotis]|uniref:glycosyltransferase family 4 protein n=1 Tax=Pseudomonas leptonychotis TaxID=2448482 RepID=UPI00386B5E6A
MAINIWYISKYIAPAYAAKVGARGFLLLREFSRMGHKSVLITSDSNHLADTPKFEGAHLHERVDDVDVYWLKTKKYDGARSIARMLSWLDFEFRLWRMPKESLPKPDVLIVSSLSLLTIFNGLWLRRRYRCKLVFEVRDIWPMVLVEAGGISSLNPFIIFLGWVEKLGYKRADLIVGTIPNLKEHVKEVTGLQRPVVCIPQGLDDALLLAPEPLSDSYVSSYIPRDKFIVCHAGSIGADNALETLLDCARLMQGRSDVHFLIVGEGYLKAQFQEQTKDLVNITFAPRVPKPAVQSVLAFADVVYFAVHKSPLLRFGQSLNKVVDYMLSGKPIVASFTGFPSMINEAGCGSYVPAEDVNALRVEIERLADMSPQERSQMGELGREWILKNRRFEMLARDYLEHLEK